MFHRVKPGVVRVKFPGFFSVQSYRFIRGSSRVEILPWTYPSLTGLTPQIRSAYSPIVRSLEN